ncbi:MAG: hydrogenase maturation protease [Candidatus Thermoplasmatota archaeon]
MKTIIVGIGNPILGDDGAGIHVVDELKKHLNNQEIIIETASTGGMNLLDMIIGYDQAILIDTMKKPDLQPGTVQQYDISELPTTHTYNPHDVSLPEALRLAQQLGQQNLPKTITIIGISLQRAPRVFTDVLSPPIAAAVPKAVELTLSLLQHHKKNLKESDT